MMKPITLAAACVLAIAPCGLVAAAEKEPAAGGATASKREQEYLAALKKCEPMMGTDRANCIDAAKKRYGQM